MSNSIENDSRQEDLQQGGSQMNDSTKCPQCSGEMPANFPPGVCPACLLMQGMSPSTLNGAEGAESGSGPSGHRRSWTPPTPAELAPRFPQWEIVELLGQGGMGAVYKVRQKDLDRWAALKVLPSDVANDPNFAERFQREARTLAQLSHQHIVTVYEFGQCDGVFYLLMEFVDGVTLRQAIRAGLVADAEAIRLSGLMLPAPSREETAPSTKPLEAPRHISPSAALGIVGQICDALQFAHEEGIVHRDIKPENILIDKRGRVKIADFGLAKLLGKQPHFPTLTGTHQIMGTPVYMAPEQMEGTKGVDHRADIFSLGVVFYELLTGELPLGRFAPPSQKYSLDVRLDEIVLRTLEKEPDRRYQQASEVKGDVESIRRSSPPAMNVAGAMDSELQKAIEKKALQVSWSKAMLHSLIAFLVTGCGFGFVIGIPVLIRSHESNPELAKQPAMLVMLVGFNFLGVLVCGYVAFHQARSAWLMLQAIVSVSRLKTEEAVQKLKADFGQQTGSTRPPQKPPRKWSTMTKVIAATLVIGLGTFAGLVGTIVLFSWRDQRQISRDWQPSVPAESNGAALHHYIGEVERQKLEQARQQQRGAESQDPFERNAVVQFTPDGVKLHPQAFGSHELNDAERKTLEKILTGIHKQYLAEEAKHLEVSDANDQQVVVIGRFETEARSLENDLWTEVDSQLPVHVQKLLRQRLPLYAGSNVRMPLVMGDGMESMSGGGGADIMAAPMSMASSGDGAMAGMPDVMGSPGMGGVIATSNLRYQQLLGWSQSKLPMRILIGRRGKWFTWTLLHVTSHPVSTFGGAGGGVVSSELQYAVLDRGEAPSLPPALKRFWREGGLKVRESATDDPNVRDAVEMPAAGDVLKAPSINPSELTAVAAIAPSLAEELQALDRLRAADKTPWDEVEKRATELLAKYTSLADKGRIHWMAAHVYGQSDIRGHGADVTRHAQEALKYERDPVQRGWLYMYLGCAAGLIEKREEATRWHLKGYLELLAFNLPDKAPELPTVGKFRGERFGPTDGEVDPDQVAVEVLQAAEVRARKEAELVRDLVKSRNVTIGLLQDLYGREYKPESDATVTLRKLATEVLRDEAIVLHLLQRVWPDSIPKS